eukprot:g60295.t1
MALRGFPAEDSGYGELNNSNNEEPRPPNDLNDSQTEDGQDGPASPSVVVAERVDGPNGLVQDMRSSESMPERELIGAGISREERMKMEQGGKARRTSFRMRTTGGRNPRAQLKHYSLEELHARNDHNYRAVAIANDPDLVPANAALEAIVPGFRFGVFLKDMIGHVFFPFSIPLVWWWENYAGLVNRGFAPAAGTLFWVQLIDRVCFFGMNYLYWYYWTEDGSMLNPLEVVVPDMFYLARACAVAIKYATYPSITLHDLRNIVAPEYQSSRLLIGGWSELVPEVLHREITIALFRSGEDLTEAYFTFNTDWMDHFDIKDCDPGGHLAKIEQWPTWVQKAENGELHARLVLSLIVSRANWYSHKGFLTGKGRWLLPLLIWFFHVFWPPLFRVFWYGEPFFGQQPFDTVIMVCAFLVVTMSLPTIVLYIEIGTQDYARRLYGLSQFTSLVNDYSSPIVQIGFSGNYAPCLPTLQFSDPANLINWFKSRRVLKEMGKSFFMRIQALFQVYFVALLVGIGYAIYIVVTGNYDVLVLVVVGVDVVLLLLAFINCTYLAAQLNQLNIDQSQLLEYRRTATLMNRYHSSVTPAEKEKLSDQADLLEPMVKSIELDGLYDPITLLNIPIDNRFVEALAAVGASTIAVLGRFLGEAVPIQ